MRQNAEDFNNHSLRSTSVLIELFNQLLEDKNFWVRQEALESFEHIGHICSEQIVSKIAKSLARIPSITKVMQAYLSDTPYYILEDFANLQDYLKHLVKVFRDCYNKHTCYQYKESKRKEKMPKIAEESSQDNMLILIQLDEQAEQLYKNLTTVLEGQASISDITCKRLINILEKILEVSKK